MKKLLYFLILTCIALSSMHAQTITWTGAVNDLFNNANNWSPAQVPTAANNVIIPTGSTMTINVSSFVKSIVVQGSSTINITNSLNFTDPSSFSSNTTVNWSAGSLYGGGTLTNNGTVKLTTGGSRYISGTTIINNNGSFKMPDGGYLYLYDTSVFNNNENGIFDLQSDAYISYSGNQHNFNNVGIFKKSGGTGTSYIYVIFSNTGTISVESGTIDMYYHPKYFNGGVYNVTSDSKLLVSTSGMNISGTLTGVLNGPLNWTGNFSVATTATFDFTGDTGVTWTSGSLIGGGNLTNESFISLTGGGSRYISGGTKLTNKDTLTMPGGGYLYLYDTSEINNALSGVFDLQSDAYISYNGNTHNFKNAGIFKKSGGSGTSYIYVIFTNTGTISVESGTIDMYYHPKHFNGGVYNVSSGSVLLVSTSGMNISGTLTGTLNGPLNWTGNFSVATIATFDFTGTTGVTWTSGSLLGGGNLTNESYISLTGGGSRYISGGTTLTNKDTVTMPGGGYLYLYDTSIFNNTVSGVFDLQSDAYIKYSDSDHNFTNAGLFKKSGGSGTSYIYTLFTNTGTISVESGTIDMYYYPKHFNGGVYNVSSGSVLLMSTSEMNISGTLTGILNGPLVWTGNFSVATTATFNFTGTTGVNWNSGSLLGGGTLINASKINLTSGGSRYISGTVTTLSNTGTINYLSGGYLYLYNDSTLDNQASGIIDFQSDGYISNGAGAGAFKIINAGLIKKTVTTGVSWIYPPVINSGTINALSGTIAFRDAFGLNNTVDGIIKGTAIIDLPAAANFINEGTFSPGGSPGILTVLGTYKSSTSSVLEVELNGLTPGTEYDVLAITGTNAIFDGTVDVAMGFDANIGDSFTIATVSGIIATKSLSSINADYGCFQYSFNISYPNNKAVVLTVSGKSPNSFPEVYTQNITVQLDATGNVSITPDQVDNGSTDNCSEPEDLVFSLDRSDFTCADIGENTVSLTVTNGYGNSSSAHAVVTVEDDMDPVISIQNISVQLDASGNATIEADDINDGSTDNCGISSMEIDLDTFGCAHIGENTVTLTVIDVNGNSSTATAVVTVNDPLGACDETPIAVCQAVTINAGEDCEANVAAQDFDGGSTDPHGDPLTFTVDPIGPYPVGTTQVMLIVSNGNSTDSCSTTITVLDNIPPAASCAAPFEIQLDASGNASITVEDIDNGSTDTCGIASISIDMTDFSCGDIGVNTVTLTVTDLGGNISTCSTVVTVTDPLGACEEAPLAVCQAIIIDADENCEANVAAEDFDGGSTDPQGNPLTFSVYPVGPYPVGTTEVVLTVDNGIATDSCTTTITVHDNLAPTVRTMNITIQLDASGNASIGTSDIDDGSSDNCGIASMALDRDTFTCSDLGQNTIVFTVTDIHGNSDWATAMVTVEDPLSSCGNINPSDYFITTWKVDESDLTITVPTTGSGYDYSIEWGDGTSISGVNGDATKTYAAAGTYTVKIYGDFPRIYFNNSGDKHKIRTIEQWGNIQWSSMNSAFMGAGSLVSNATDMPNLSMVTDMYGMFAYATSFNGDANMGNWSVSNVTNMYGTFGGALNFNADIGNWDVSNVTNMKLMFSHTHSFNQDIGNWDVGNVRNMDSMFRNATAFDQNIGGWNVGNVLNMRNMFKDIALSTANYDALLNGWNTLTLKNNVKFSAGNSTYCNGELARQNIVAAFNWTITDGGLDCGDGMDQRSDVVNPKTLADITLYPNPMQKKLILGNPKNIQLESASIYDLTGRLISKIDLRAMTSEMELDVTVLSSATYLIFVNGQNGERISKMMIKE